MSLSSASLAVSLVARVSRAYEDRTLNPEMNIQISETFTDGDDDGEVEMIGVMDHTATTSTTEIDYQDNMEYPLDASASPTEISQARVLLLQNLGEVGITWDMTSGFVGGGPSTANVLVPPGGFALFYAGSETDIWTIDIDGGMKIYTGSGTSAFRLWVLGILNG